MLGLPRPDQDCPPPSVVISDGELIAQSLQKCNLKEDWLFKQLKEHDIELKDVFLMVCDQNATYFLLPKEKTGKKAVKKK